MAFDKETKEKISIEVIKTLIGKFIDFPDVESSNRNAPFHEAFLKAFADQFDGKVTNASTLISFSSWLQGLNTTLGQSFFEKVAHSLCDGEKREYTSKKLGNLRITQKQKDIVTKIIANLSDKTAHPNLSVEDTLILQGDQSEQINAIDFSADVFFTRDDDIIAIEIKTVQPNSGGSMNEKQKILEGKAAFSQLYPNQHIHFFLGFPFDPSVDPKIESVTSGDKTRFSKSIVNLDKFFDMKEILLADELWDFLSGDTNTMQQIIDIINVIATPAFIDQYRFLNDPRNRSDWNNYRQQLVDWNLFREITWLDTVLHCPNKSKNLKKKLDQLVFDKDGKYRSVRLECLQ